MMLSFGAVAGHVPPPGAGRPAARQLSGPGDSTSRSRSLTSVPPPPFPDVPSVVFGGAGQLRAMRSWPFPTNRLAPGWMVLTASTTKVFSARVAVLLIGG